MKMKKKFKNLKPIEFDIHLKYQCKCGEMHWLSFDEASEPDFVIVCECKRLLKVKPIAGVIIKYKEERKNSKKIKLENNNSNIDHQPIIVDSTTDKSHTIENNKEPEPSESPELSEEFKTTCVNLLTTFGYSKREALILVIDFYDKNKTLPNSIFLKQLLASLGKKI